jgi:hypothetical protein
VVSFGAVPVGRPFSHGRDALQERPLRVAALAALATDPKPLRWTTRGVQQNRKNPR